MQIHKTPILPHGFSCCSKNCGLKESGADLSLFYSRVPARSAAVFTLNQFPGAPVILGREIIKNGILRAIVVNSKISNVGTGQQGLNNAKKMAVAVAKEMDIKDSDVIMSSTGVIGTQLPIELIEKGIQGMGGQLEENPMSGAEGIMTTDTYPKAISVSVGDSVLTMVAKGPGMIEPNMATMLAYIFTDAGFSAEKLDQMLRVAMNQSLNMLSVDTDTSTSDTCVLMANGLAGPIDEELFQKALNYVSIEMTKLLARDGEGATKLLETRVIGAKSDNEARIIAKSLVNSPLIKTMTYGADPNIGRVLMAVGKCFDCEIKRDKLEFTINGTLVYKNNDRTDFDEKKVRHLLGGDQIVIEVNLNIGHAEATAYGCDLTEGYIEENAAYYSS
ncbi:MAG: bifunctional glutamate N-acetyltransferase/amino-acid acetyltransferase ArgJ [Proteobacteria bacterium]|nr:bifunctional glutamate N-acetyltransferase/amino-acid acetyltransferase ArgJ [Pseudomonadota bacterium]